MANVAKNAILRAKLGGVLTDLMPKTITDNVYVNGDTTLTAYLATLATGADLETLKQAVEALGGLAKKDQISQADLDEALAALIDSKAAQADLEALAGRVTTVEGQVTTLIGEDAGKSVRTIANEELAAQLIGENAKESLDTLEEIAKWIQDHPDDAAAMNAAITALQQQMVGIAAGEGTVKKYVDDAIAALSIGDYAKAADLTALAGRVTTLEQTAEGLGALATKDKIAQDDLDDQFNAFMVGQVTAINTLNGDDAGKSVRAIAGEVLEGANLGDLATKDIVSEADLDEALAEKVNAAAEGNHSHTNKDVLDGITADVVNAWNGKGNIYYSAEEPANLTENDLWVAIVD